MNVVRIASSDAKALDAELPAPSKVLPKNSSGDLVPAAVLYSLTRGLASIMSVTLFPPTIEISEL